MVGVSNTPRWVVDANLLLLNNGIDLLTAGCGSSDKVSGCGDGGIVGTHLLSLSGRLLS